MNDLQKSYLKKAEDLTEKYKSLRDQIREFANYEALLKTQILDLFTALEVDKVNGVKAVEKIKMKRTGIGNIAEMFSGDEKDIVENMLKYFVVEIDLEMTLDHLKMLAELPDTLVKKIGNRLLEIQKTSYTELEVGK